MWANPAVLVLVGAALGVIGNIAWRSYFERRNQFIVNYVYGGLPRMNGVLTTSRDIAMDATFPTLAAALGFIKSLADRGYPHISLTDRHRNLLLVGMSLSTDEEHMQYELYCNNAQLGISREKLLIMLSSSTHPVELCDV